MNSEKKHSQFEIDSAEGANAHMHQRSVEELIQRFESSERDVYQKPQEVLDFIGDVSGKKIIDIGAGSGYFSVKLAGRGAQVIAADVNEEFQNYLRLRIVEEGLKEHIETRLIPYDSPNLEPSEVDMALIVNTYHHIEDRVPYFSDVLRGLKKEGELLVVDFFKVEMPMGPPVDHKVSMDVVIDELKKAGYEKIETEVNLLPYQYIIRAQ
ncbi:MAG: methyltransferase domain-containing protein [Bacteroidetes bacterium]|nr:methyltransferase domain-containing protein [Bacteroidota bacterium]